MSAELARGFRRGESIGKPWGGNVSNEPFPQALYNLVRSRGYESQSAFARALGKKQNSNISHWYKGRSTPTPDELGSILRLLKPSDGELDTLLEPYEKLLQEGKGNKTTIAGSERAREMGIKLMRPASTPFDGWLKRLCQERELTIKEAIALLGFSRHSFGGAKKFGLKTYSEILQRAPSALDLSEEEVDSLSNVVAQSIQQKIASGHRFQDSPGGRLLRKPQSRFVCQTYTGEDVAKKLSITRERVRQIRQELSLPLLLTEEHIEILRKRQQLGKSFRRKQTSK